MTHPSPSNPRAGFSLVETLIALTMLAIVLLTLAPLSMRAARGAVEAHAATYATAAVSTEFNRLDAMSFDSLAAGTTCTTVSTPPFPYTRCVTVTNVSTQKKQLMVVVTPSGNMIAKPDTSITVRTQTNKSNPLNTP